MLISQGTLVAFWKIMVFLTRWSICFRSTMVTIWKEKTITLNTKYLYVTCLKWATLKDWTWLNFLLCNFFPWLGTTKGTDTVMSVLALREVLVAEAGKSLHKQQLQTSARVLLGWKKKDTNQELRNQPFLSLLWRANNLRRKRQKTSNEQNTKSTL